MLLRSSSAPILSSLLLYSKESSPESEHILKFPRTLSILSLNQSIARMDLQNSSSPKKRNCVPCGDVLSAKIQERNEVKVAQQKTCMTKVKPSTQKLFPSHGLDVGVMDHIEFGGMGSSSDGGCKGGGRGSDGIGWNSQEGNNNGRDRMDAYYQNMIEANPGDALLLGNYAKFLKEVQGDYTKAEEYLGRAILSNPGDGDILSLYADLISQTGKNVDRAEVYFDQAIKSAPDDCYVMASYAKFLWDVEDEEEDKDCQNEYPTYFFQETKCRPRWKIGF